MYLFHSAVIDATWEAWKRAEGGPSACEPTLRIGIDLDRISLDLRPSDLATVARIHDDANEIFRFTEVCYNCENCQYFLCYFTQKFHYN